MIFCTRLGACSRCMNGPRSVSKCVISITFWNVFDIAKSSHCQRLADFLKNKGKTWSQKSDRFSGHLHTGTLFFNFFTRPRKKRDIRGDWWVLIIKFRGSAHTQKWAKSDASRSVDGFGGVRNGDRIRASGDVLFFHIVKFHKSALKMRFAAAIRILRT